MSTLISSDLNLVKISIDSIYLTMSKLLQLYIIWCTYYTFTCLLKLSDNKDIVMREDMFLKYFEYIYIYCDHVTQFYSIPELTSLLFKSQLALSSVLLFCFSNLSAWVIKYVYLYEQLWINDTPARTLSTSGLKSRVLKLPFLT